MRILDLNAFVKSIFGSASKDGSGGAGERAVHAAIRRGLERGGAASSFTKTLPAELLAAYIEGNLSDADERSVQAAILEDDGLRFDLLRGREAASQAAEKNLHAPEALISNASLLVQSPDKRNGTQAWRQQIRKFTPAFWEKWSPVSSLAGAAAGVAASVVILGIPTEPSLPVEMSKETRLADAADQTRGVDVGTTSTTLELGGTPVNSAFSSLSKNPENAATRSNAPDRFDLIVQEQDKWQARIVETTRKGHYYYSRKQYSEAVMQFDFAISSSDKLVEDVEGFKEFLEGSRMLAAKALHEERDLQREDNQPEPAKRDEP